MVPHLPGFMGRPGLGAVECLDLRFLIDRHDDGIACFIRGYFCSIDVNLTTP